MKLLVPDSWAALEPWIDIGVLGAFEVHAADAIVRLGTPVGEPPPSPAVVLGAALALWAPLRGHACIDLADAPAIVAASAARPSDAEGDTDATAAPPDVGALAWPEPARWLDALAASPLVRVVARHDPVPTPGTRPLVLHGSRLYTQRQWIDECTVAAALTARLEERTAAPAGRHEHDDRQVEAVEAASGHALTVVVGGPGTGKTHTIARLLARVLTDQPDARIGLAAPTGKAAARLTASVHEAAATGTWSHDVTAALGRLEALTLHRLLGWRPGSRTRFRHDAAHPLAVDVVVVDETSMVPLPIMARLLEAMPVTARVVLVGDPDQLESVEVGAVLGDIVRSTAMRPAVVRLERQYRTAVGSPIAELAGLVRQGRADDVLDLLHAGADGLTYVGFAAGAAAVREAVLADLLAARDAATSGDAPGALVHVGAQRVLCAHRRGPFGVAEWSRTVRGWVQGPLDRPAPGDVVLATRNDARTGTNNGDTGVLVLRDGALVAAFARGAAAIERAPAQIAGLEAAYAMTVHKSQGSEYDTVALIHPPESSPLVGRELLYTAVTRAARRLVIVADDAAVRRAVLTPARRVTGLVDALDVEP